MLIIILNLVLLASFGTGLYSYITIDPINIAENGGHAKNLALTLFIISILITLFIDGFYFLDYISNKRAFLNLSLLTFLCGIFTILIYVYLNLQRKSPAGYSAALDTLKNNSINVNESQLEINAIFGVIISFIFICCVSFYAGFNFYAKEIIVKKKETYVIKDNKKNNNKRPKLNTKFLF